MIVYQVTNKINNKKYIGITSQRLSQRLNEHKLRAKKEGGQKNIFYAAINKYGFNNFDIKVLRKCNSKQEMINSEIELIKKLKPEYNITQGGSVGCLGYKWSDEKRKKMSEQRKGLFSGKKNPMYGKPCSEEVKEKMRLKLKGKLNPMKRPDVYAKYLAAMSKRYGKTVTARKAG